MNEKVFSVRLPAETFEELRTLAEARRVTVADLIRMFIRLGMLATSEDGPKLMVKDGEELRPVFVL
jgi:predicted DNA-binding protein